MVQDSVDQDSVRAPVDNSTVINKEEEPLIDLSGDTLTTENEKNNSDHQSNYNYFQSLNSINNTDLPLYTMVCNGKKVDVLLDSGASCSYVSPSLASGCPVYTVSDREVETAGGHKFPINRAVTLSINAAGLIHDVFAYVLDTKFDLILGRDWIKRMKPVPNWDQDMWVINYNHQQYTLRPKFNRLVRDLTYLISHRQMNRLTKNNQVQDLFVCYSSMLPQGMEQSQHDKLQQFRQEYPEVFQDNLPGLPPHRDIHHIIDTGDAEPINRPPYKMSPLELDELRKQLDELLALGFIQPSMSPWGAPVLFVRKKNGEMRLCVDYRALNQVTKRHSHPLPRIDECLERLSQAKYFSSIDLKSGYHQLRIRPEDVPKTAMNTRYGSFEWLVLGFGLRNAPPAFQSVINKALDDCIDKYALVYLDDILIYSKTYEDHENHVRQVLNRLRDAKLVANIKKTELFKTELEFVGFHISAAGILPSKSKVKAIQDWPVPTNVQMVRQFIGLCSHYRRFIRGFSSITSCLTDLTKGTGAKKRSIVWTQECQAAFEKIKNCMTAAPVLLPPDPAKPYIIEVDSSDYSVGGVLMQEDDAGVMHPVAFESKKLSMAECAYPAQERELLAVLHALRIWCCFVEGRQFVVRTDHHPLVYFRSRRKPPPPRLIRWMAELELYDPIIQYKKGTENVIPDLLSRRDGPDCTPAEQSMEPDYLYALKSIEESDWPKFYSFDPPKWPSIYKDLLMKHQDKFIVKDGQIYRKVKSGSTIQEIRFALFARRADIVHHFHTSFGHPGIATLFDLIKKRWWWPNMKEDIQNWIRNCPQCQLGANADRNTHHAPMKPLDVPEPFARWHLDFMGELPKTINGNRWILVAVDYATNWTITRALPDATGQAIADFIYEEIVMRFGCPIEILTDRGSNFMSKVLNFYLGRVKIHHKATSAFHPRSNSKVERSNFILKQMIRKYVNGEIHRWDDFLMQSTFSSNIRKHRTTGLSPYFMVYGVEPRLPGDTLTPLVNQTMDEPHDFDEMVNARKSDLIRLREARADAIERLRANAERDKAIWDATLKHQIFSVGDHVLMRHEQKLSLEYNWKGPYVVLDRHLDHDTYKLQDLHGKEYGSWVHTDRLRPIHSQSTPQSPWFDPVAAHAATRAFYDSVPSNALALVRDDQ